MARASSVLRCRDCDEQRALELTAELREALRILEEFDDLLKLSRASSMPATSWKVTLPCFSVSSLALDLPKPIARPRRRLSGPDAAEEAMPRMRMNGSDWMRT